MSTREPRTLLYEHVLNFDLNKLSLSIDCMVVTLKRHVRFIFSVHFVRIPFLALHERNGNASLSVRFEMHCNVGLHDLLAKIAS